MLENGQGDQRLLGAHGEAIKRLSESEKTLWDKLDTVQATVTRVRTQMAWLMGTLTAAQTALTVWLRHG